MVAYLPSAELRLVADVDSIDLFRERPGVWLTFTGSAYYRAYASQLAQHGLKPAWITALAIVEQHHGITQSELGRFVSINRASAMALAVELEDAGLLSRTVLPGRNKTALSITAAGMTALETGCRIEEQLTEEALAGFSTLERTELIQKLQRIEQTLRKRREAE